MNASDFEKSLTESTDHIRTILHDSSIEICSHKNENSWSIFEVVEHLIMVETGIITNIKNLLAENSNNALENPTTHESIIEKSASREVKVDAPAVFKPTGVFDNIQGAMSAFQEHRDKTALFISTNTLDLSLIAFPHPRFGMFDGNNWLSFIIGHGRRHAAQIMEIKESVPT